MINSVSNEQAYINALMAKLPDVKEKEEYSLKKGDSLWSLAKKCLNDQNASNAKTANYMLLIAKLNKLDTVEKMNGLKVGQKIYLPNEILKSENPTKIRSDAENVNRKGEIDVVSMNDAKKDLYAFGYDYDVDQKGNIIEAKYPHYVKGKLSKEENLALRSKLKELVNNMDKK